jgi:hypothetical protein
MEINEYIVVGSSFCGVMAAKTLIDAGAKVLLLDVGVSLNTEKKATENSFINIRKNDPNQSDFLIGNQFEALANLIKKNPVHLTPNRSFTINKVAELLNWTEGEFIPTESLAKGGLGSGWGLGSYVYSDNELRETGLDVNAMQKAYKWIASIIGISGGNDNSANYATGNYLENQQPIDLDFNGKSLYEKSIKHKEKLAKKGFIVGRTPLAISTENDKNGKIHQNDDLDFYSTGTSSAYRPQVTLNELLKNDNFKYQKNQMVLDFKELENNIIQVNSLDILTNEKKAFYTKKLLLSSGTLGTARIVMRSLEIDKLPIICNPYTYIPSVQIQHLGARNTDYQTGLAQLSLYFDLDKKNTTVAMGSLYSYRSLMGFRLLNQFPMDTKNGMNLLKLLQPALNITGVFHPEYGSENKYIQRVFDSNSPTNDSMKSRYVLSEKEEEKIRKTEKAFKNALQIIGTIPLKVQQNHHGSSIHYGGTMPYNQQNAKASLQKNGSLAGFKNVFVTDGSGFQFLSGKGLTLTLMAHSHLIAKNALKSN